MLWRQVRGAKSGGSEMANEGGATEVAGKMGAAVLSEQLITRFFSKDLVEYPDHTLAWLAIGSMAAISPIGLLIFRKVFSHSEQIAEQEAAEFTREATDHGDPEDAADDIAGA